MDWATWMNTIRGIINDAARFLVTMKPLAFGGESWRLDAVPSISDHKVIYDHILLLKEHGIYILETISTERLVRESVWEFMFGLGHPRIKRAVQMMINPMAMW